MPEEEVKQQEQEKEQGTQESNTSIPPTALPPFMRLADINTAYTSALARIEAINIVVNVVNSIIISNSDKITEETLKSIQQAINEEQATTENMLKSVRNALGEK